MTSLFEIRREAQISACAKYRYHLVRHWDDGAQPLPIIMLNPSIADASIDDPTIKRCMAFARREMFGGIRVFNLFAFRATDPAKMMAAGDPIGPENDQHIEDALDRSASSRLPVLAAWGVSGKHLGRAQAVMAMAKRIGANMQCLGKTQGGDPRHPLYVKRDSPLIPFG